MTRLAKAWSAFTDGRSGSADGRDDGRSSAIRASFSGIDGSGAPSHVLVGEAGPDRVYRATVVLAALFTSALLILALAPLADAAKRTDAVVAGNFMNDFAGGQLNSPRGVAVNSTGAGDADPGDFYVVDGGYNRIQHFNADGDFIRALGRDVIAPSVNERQLLRHGSANGGIQASSPTGTYTLTFDPDGPGGTPPATTGPISPGNINATTMRNNIAPIVGGTANVTVTAGTGGSGGSPNTYIITFTGALAGADQPELILDSSNLEGGRAYISTLADGAAATADTGTGFEECTVLAHCKAGANSPPEGGTFNNPQGIAVDQSTGDIYVTDSGNRRVQKFDSSGSWERAWGHDVVPPGGTGDVEEPPVVVNERQTVTVSGAFDFGCFCSLPVTGGTFTVTFEGQTTAAIPYDATAALFQEALEELSNIDPGEIAVTGGPSPGAAFTVEFIAGLGGTNHAQMTGNPAGLEPSGFVSVSTPQNGSTSFTGPAEVCTVATECRAGTVGSLGGEFGNLGHLAVAPAGSPHAGDVFVAETSNRRIQQFEADGSWVRAWGWDVVQPGGTGEVSTDLSERQTVEAYVCKGFFGCTRSPATGGTFTLTFDGETTDPISPEAPATGAGSVQAELEALPGIGSGDVTVTKPSATNSWTIDFTGALAGTDVPQLSGNGAALEGGEFGAPGNVEVTTNQPGGPTPGFEICTVIDECKEGANSIPVNSDGSFANNNPVHVAAGADGTLYASDSAGSNRIARFDTAETTAASLLMPSFTGFGNATTGGMAMTASGNLMLSRNTGLTRVFELANPATSPTLADNHYLNFHHHSGSQPVDTVGLALNMVNGDLFATTTSGGPRLFVADDDGATPAAVVNKPPTSITPTSAILEADITPGVLDTFYRFQISGDGVEWEDVTSNAFIPENSPQVTVQAEAGPLLPNNIYHVRVLTSKVFGANFDLPSNVLTFTTEAIPPSVVAVNADSITDTSARFTGRVNPHSSTTTYRFEYGVGNFANQAPAILAPLGSGSSFIFIAESISSLQPATTYQYRLTAINPEGEVNSPTRTFTTLAQPPAPEDRAYEMVSPPAKFSGNGVGNPSGTVAALAASAGSAAYVGERFAVAAHLGAIMLDSPFSTATDWAFSKRVSDGVGWLSHSPMTRPFACNEPYRMQFMQQASPDFSTVTWGQNGGDLPIFKGMCDLENANSGAGLVSDWGNPPDSPTRWEPLGPFDLSQTFNTTGTAGGYFPAPEISADGTHLGLSGPLRGLLGPDDPSLDTLGAIGFSGGAHTAYVYDISAGLSDSFPGEAVRHTAASCTGDDGGPEQDRTRIPARNPDGSLGAVACDPPQESPARDSRLVSAYGSAVTWTGGQQDVGTSEMDVISADGSRTFFMAPDPKFNSNPGHTACNADTGTATKCPAQLYVRQRNDDGEVVTRWISRPDAGLLDEPGQAALLGPAYYEGASADGSRVFFRTASPLTADDPNGATQTPANPNPTTQRSESSWDLYMAKLSDGPDPTGSGFELTRITAGPNGDSDCSTKPTSQNVAALRFASEDGMRAYFVCAAPLGGLPDRDTGTEAGAQGGTPTTSDQLNLYVYDDAAAPEDRYSFIARLPRVGASVPDSVVRCATTQARRGPLQHPEGFNDNNCWRGTDDGSFAIFVTPGRLTKDDPDELSPSPSLDIYAYDAAGDELIRVSAPQGTLDETYPCTGGGSLACYAELGYNGGAFDGSPNPLLNVVTDPAIPGERIVYFQSASRLVDADQNDVYDVYEWRDGRLSLFSAGTPESEGAAYKGNSADGKNVYLLSKERLTWQDVDVVADIYTARLGSQGIPQPPQPFVCVVLNDGCQPPSPQPPAASPAASGSFEGQGNFVAPTCAKSQVLRGDRCVAKRAIARRACAKRKGKAKRRCVRSQTRRLNRSSQRRARTANADRRAHR